MRLEAGCGTELPGCRGVAFAESRVTGSLRVDLGIRVGPFGLADGEGLADDGLVLVSVQVDGTLARGMRVDERPLPPPTESLLAFMDCVVVTGAGLARACSTYDHSSSVHMPIAFIP